MSADAQPRRPQPLAPLLRITAGHRRGQTGRGQISGAKARIDLGPLGGVVDVPADIVEEIDETEGSDGWNA